MKPRVSSAGEKRVSCGGAPANAPGGGGSRPDAASAAATGNRPPIIMRAAISRFMKPSRRLAAPHAHQAFLGDGRDQRTVAGKDQTAGKAARAVQIGRVLRVEQPVIGAERPVQPQRMIETRRHEFL